MSACHQYKYERDSLCSFFAFNSFNSHREFQTSGTSPSGPAMFQVSGSHPPPVVMATILDGPALGWGFPGGSVGKEPACSAGDAGDAVRSLGREDPLEEGMATHSSILAWRIPWTEEPGGLYPQGHKESTRLK